MRAALFGLLAISMSWLAIGQSKGPSFEVASVKPVGAGRIGAFTGGPGSSDPERITFEAATMEVLIQSAFDLMPYQISGPSWIRTERYAVTAKLPPGTTGEQLRQMMVNLLAERFGLVYHQQMKDFPGYAIVATKGGSKVRAKLKPTTHSDPSALFYGASDGFGTIRYQLTQTSMHLLTNRISMMLRTGPGALTTPVVDHTGISGKFDFTLDVPSEIKRDLESVAVDISDALQQQLGLRLERAKVPLPMVIVDHVERVPPVN